MALLCQVVLPMRSGIPSDVVVNDFAIGGLGAGSPEGDVTAALTGIIGFYTSNMPVTADDLGALLSPAMSRVASACHVKVYDISAHLDGSPHGSPFRTEPFTLGPTASTNGFPEEVACCLTLEASNRALQLVETADGVDVGTARDRPRQRYTGRIYVGPFIQGTGVSVADANGIARPSTNLRGDLGPHLAARAAYIKANTTGGWLGVWSRKNQELREIDNVAIDDAWDTMRSRGPKPTARTRTAVTGAGVEVELAA